MVSNRRLELTSRFFRTAGSCAALFTKGISDSKQRERIGQLSRFFGHVDVPAPELATVAIDELTDARVPVVLREVDAVSGNVSLLELVSLVRLVRTQQPRRLFEIGTFDGRTALNLAANAPDDAIVYTLDLPAAAEQDTAFALHDAERRYVRKPASGHRVHQSDVAHKVTQLFGDSGNFDFKPYGEEGMDFVFVNGLHTYEYARSDSLNAMAMLRG